MPHHATHQDAKSSKKAGGGEHAAKKITDLVVEDHIKVKSLYAEIQQADDQHGEPLYQKMCWEIALHAVAEELILYPLQESMDKEGKKNAEESREDHEKTKAALQDLDGKSLKEKGVREKVDLMMKDLLEHMGKEETEDLVKLEELGDEKLIVAGHDFQQTKVLIPDVAPSNQAHSDKDADKAEQDSHFKTPMALLLASTDKLKEILGTHSKSESVSINKSHSTGAPHRHTKDGATDRHTKDGATDGHGKSHSEDKKKTDDVESGAKGDDGGADIPYNLRHRDEKGHVVPDDVVEGAADEGQQKKKNGGVADKAANGAGHHDGGNGQEDGGKNHHGKRSKDTESPDASSRKKVAGDSTAGHEQGEMEVDTGDKNGGKA